MPTRLDRYTSALALAAHLLGLCACGASSAALTDVQQASDDRSPVASGTSATSDAPSLVGVGEIFGEDIATVQFGLAGLELSNPIVELGGAADLRLAFDVLSDEVREFRYDITHCNADWQPSQLSEIDYLASFTEGDIRDYNLSFNAVSDYTHYTLTLPNQYVAWTKSGNYLLNVYDDDSGDLVMRLRFCVVEPVTRVLVNNVRPATVSLDKTHQEFDAAINLRDARFENPRRTLTLTAMQNGDWRTAVHTLAPRFVRGDQLSWDYQNVLVWPAHREWRALDLRTLESEGGRVDEVTREDEVFSARLFAEPSRSNFPPETRIDLNGKYIIEDFDNRFDLQAEYAQTFFTLKMPRDESIEPLYLYGALTNYKLDESNQGAWNTLTNAYVFSTNLKQGFYNYAFVSADEEAPDWTQTEGNWFQTENEYQFLIYYRPYGERYDRLVGYESVQVNR